MAERLGVAAVSVITTQFVSAADLMATVLGMQDYSFAVIDHPISSATPDALLQSATDTLQQLKQMVVSR